MAIALSAVGVPGVVVPAAWLARRVPHPGETATHGDVETDPSTSSRLYQGADRRAGPDAEDPVGPARLGLDDAPVEVDAQGRRS